MILVDDHSVLQDMVLSFELRIVAATKSVPLVKLQLLKLSTESTIVQEHLGGLICTLDCAAAISGSSCCCRRL
jgi:hypothetical protein